MFYPQTVKPLAVNSVEQPDADKAAFQASVQSTTANAVLAQAAASLTLANHDVHEAVTDFQSGAITDPKAALAEIAKTEKVAQTTIADNVQSAAGGNAAAGSSLDTLNNGGAIDEVDRACRPAARYPGECRGPAGEPVPTHDLRRDYPADPDLLQRRQR